MKTSHSGNGTLCTKTTVHSCQSTLWGNGLMVRLNMGEEIFVCMYVLCMLITDVINLSVRYISSTDYDHF